MKRKQSKKDIERSHALQAAFKLGEEWRLEEREAPDFLVSTDQGSFGLEVTECFIGPKGAGRAAIGKETAAPRGVRRVVLNAWAAMIHL